MSIPIAIMFLKNEGISYQIYKRGILVVGFQGKKNSLEPSAILRIVKSCNCLPKNMFCKRNIVYNYCVPLSLHPQK